MHGKTPGMLIYGHVGYIQCQAYRTEADFQDYVTHSVISHTLECLLPKHFLI